MKMKSKLLLSLVAILSIVGSAELCAAAGFALYEGSARANALGGAVVGRADDPSALFFNPAGITQLPGLQMMGGATFIMPSTDVTTKPAGAPAATSSTESNVWIPPHLYITYQATDKVWLGLGLFSPFGLGTEFDENWPGRYNNYEAVIQTLNFNPNIAIKLNDQVSLAAGLDIMYFDLTLKNKISVGDLGDISNSLEGDSVGVGLNFAIHYKLCDWMRLGASYRSQIKQHVEGDATFTKPKGIPAQFFNSTEAGGSVTLPDEIFFGATFYPIKDLSFELGGIWTHWGTYDALTVNFDNPPVPGLYSSTSTKSWRDTWRLVFGAEYKTTDWLDLRVGFAWDQDPIKDSHADYLVPSNDRYLFSFGPGFRWQNWTLDLSYTYLLITDRDNVPARPQDDVYKSSFNNGDAHLIGCSLGYKF